MPHDQTLRLLSDSPRPAASGGLRALLRCLTPRHAGVLLSGDGLRFTLPEPVRWQLLSGGKRIAEGCAQTAALILDPLEPETDYLLEIAGGDRLRFRTPACRGISDITRFGARETSADNSAALHAAIAATPPGGTVLVPAGRWHSAPVFLRSGITLHLAEGAVLAALPDRTRFPVLPALHPDGRMLASWEGLPEASFASLITAIDARDIAVTGRGALDGGGAEGDWWSWPKETRDGARRPRTLFLSGCTDVALSGVTVRNSPSWTVHPLLCKRLEAFGLTIENPPDSPNTDGFNPECCEDVTLDALRISVGDDCIAIKAGKRGPTGDARHLARTARIAVRQSLLERGHGGVVLGSEMSGGVHDVTIRDCEFRGTDRGLRIKTRRGRGGEVARITLSGCMMDDVDTAVSINAFYFCDADGRSEAVQSRLPAPVTEATPRIADITVETTEIRNLRVAVGAFFGLPEAPLRRITLRDLRVSFDDSTEGDVPDMALDLPVLHHAAIAESGAEITAINLTLPDQTGDLPC